MTNSIQFIKNGGGFILHKIPHLNQRISAWFDPKGEIEDAQFMPSGRQVKPGGPAWRKAEFEGKIRVGLNK